MIYAYHDGYTIEILKLLILKVQKRIILHVMFLLIINYDFHALFPARIVTKINSVTLNKSRYSVEIIPEVEKQSF